MSSWIFLIPLLPFVGFLFNFTFGVLVLSRGGHAEGGHPGAGTHAQGPSKVVGLVACLAVGFAFLLSLLAVLEAHGQADHTIRQVLWTWIPGASVMTAHGSMAFQVDWAYQVDPLSSVMLLVVTFVGFFIHLYSTAYMAHDPGYARFMAYLNLFMFAMLTLVLGANYLLLFVGWEGVGLCSYLLIGFWFEKQSATDAGKKAFIVNRVGDAGFILGAFLMFVTFGSLDFVRVNEAAAKMPVEMGWGGSLTLMGLFLFWGACGKSAQIPLYVWLPDAMEGPTPVSALIHAATMVTAGVYMVARSAAIYSRAPNALFVVALVGALTAIFAASIGLVQNDIKRVLAYSTVSQLGYMFLACGVGAFHAGVFHLATHAFFKALLFLGAGSVIHGMSGEQDMRAMGGLRKLLPTTHWTMAIGCLAIAGIPPLAGFFSKDEILFSAYKAGGYGSVVWAVGLAAAVLTAFYMFRLYYMTFWGSFRGTEEQAHHVHESPWPMTLTLMVLAGGSVVAGFIGLPSVFGGSAIERFLEPALEPAREALEKVFSSPAPGASTELSLMGLSVLVALGGIGVATLFYLLRTELPSKVAASLAFPYRVLLNKYYVDEAYNAVFVRGAALGGGRVLFGVDRFVLDGGDGEVRPSLGVNGVAWLVGVAMSFGSNLWDRGIVDGMVNAVGAVFDNLSYFVRQFFQDGLLQHYVLWMLIGFVTILAVNFWVG